MAKLRNYKKGITTPDIIVFVSRILLGVAPKALAMFFLDNFEVLIVLKAGSNVAPHNRIDYLTHANFCKHLIGQGHSSFYWNFLASLLSWLPLLNIKDEWTELFDIIEFWMLLLTITINKVIARSILNCVNPNFTQDSLKFYSYSYQMIVGTSRYYILKVYCLREKLVQDVK